MVTLYELDQTNTTLKGWLTACVKPDKIHAGSISGLLHQVGELAEGPFVLPFVPVNKSMKNLLAIPKDLVSTRITMQLEKWTGLTEKEKGREALKYSYWPGTKRLCTISEPFLTPIIKHVLNTIAGNGVPDYPESMKTILKRILEEFSKTDAPATK
jgi:hypothetical protein